MIAVLATAGLLITVAKYEFDMSDIKSRSIDDWAKELANKDPYKSERWEWDPNLYRVIVLGLSIASVICTLFRQYFKDQWFRIFVRGRTDKSNVMVNYYGERVTKRVDDQADFAFLKRRWSKWLWFEMFILLVCPIPFVEFYVT